MCCKGNRKPTARPAATYPGPEHWSERSNRGSLRRLHRCHPAAFRITVVAELDRGGADRRGPRSVRLLDREPRLHGRRCSLAPRVGQLGAGCRRQGGAGSERLQSYSRRISRLASMVGSTANRAKLEDCGFGRLTGELASRNRDRSATGPLSHGNRLTTVLDGDRWCDDTVVIGSLTNWRAVSDRTPWRRYSPCRPGTVVLEWEARLVPNR